MATPINKILSNQTQDFSQTELANISASLRDILGQGGGGGGGGTEYIAGTGLKIVDNIISVNTNGNANNDAANKRNFVEGSWTVASGYNCHAEGVATSALGYGVHAQGMWTCFSSNDGLLNGGGYGPIYWSDGAGATVEGYCNATTSCPMSGTQGEADYGPVHGGVLKVIGNGHVENEDHETDVHVPYPSDALIVYRDGTISAAGKISANGVELGAGGGGTSYQGRSGVNVDSNYIELTETAYNAITSVSSKVDRADLDDYVPYSATELVIGDGNEVDYQYDNVKNHFVQGTDNIVSNNNSETFVQGRANKLSTSQQSFVQGFGNSATNYYNFAQGAQNNATNYSLAQGSNNTANNYSQAAGQLNTATAKSFAFGDTNTADNLSFAQGESNSASDKTLAQGIGNSGYYCSLVQGYYNSAYNYGLAQGYQNTAEYESFAQGMQNYAGKSGGSHSLAQGYQNSAVYQSMAQGFKNTAYYDSFAQGFENSAFDNSMAQGLNNTAHKFGVAIGENNKADEWSIAQGQHNRAYNLSQAFGFRTIASGTTVNGHNYGTMAIGYCNSTSASALFVVGNGYLDEHSNVIRSDAFIIYPDGSVSAAGKISANGVELGAGGGGGGDLSNYVPYSAISLPIGTNNNVTNYSMGIGYSNTANYGDVSTSQQVQYGSLAFGYQNSASKMSFAAGHENKALHVGFAVGYNCTATEHAVAMNNNCSANDYSFAEGDGSKANNYSFVEGKTNIANSYSFAGGKNCSANDYSFAYGENASANGRSFAYGPANIAYNYSHLFGRGLEYSGASTAGYNLGAFVIGGWNATTSWETYATSPLFIIGNGGSTRSDAFIVYRNGAVRAGNNTTASESNAVAFGSLTQASGNAAFAAGAWCYAIGQGAHAEGNSCGTTGYGNHIQGSFNVFESTGDAYNGPANTPVFVGGTLNATTAQNYSDHGGYLQVMGNGTYQSQGTGTRSDAYILYRDGTVKAKDFIAGGDTLSANYPVPKSVPNTADNTLKVQRMFVVTGDDEIISHLSLANGEGCVFFEVVGA